MTSLLNDFYEIYANAEAAHRRIPTTFIKLRHGQLCRPILDLQPVPALEHGEKVEDAARGLVPESRRHDARLQGRGVRLRGQRAPTLRRSLPQGCWRDCARNTSRVTGIAATPPSTCCMCPIRVQDQPSST